MRTQFSWIIDFESEMGMKDLKALFVDCYMRIKDMMMNDTGSEEQYHINHATCLLISLCNREIIDYQPSVLSFVIPIPCHSGAQNTTYTKQKEESIIPSIVFGNSCAQSSTAPKSQTDCSSHIHYRSNVAG